MARLVITAVTVEGRSKSEVARDYRVSRRWVQKLLARYQREGDTAFEPRSRRPHHSPHQVSAKLENEIVRLRKTLADQGLDAGAATIAFHLAQRHDQVPAVATIHRVLCRRGFVSPQPHKRPRSSWIRFAAEQPNERWQADVTHWTLADDTEAEILNLLDDHSRLALASESRASFKAPDVVRVVIEAARAYGLPAGLLTDNAAIFTAAYRRHGWVALEHELVELGVALRHSRPNHPQTCGKVERFHQTLKKWLARQPKAATLAELQAQLAVFIRYYNQHRPHRALGRRTPAHVYLARPKAVPSRPGIAVPAHFRVRQDRVDDTGVVTLRHNSRLHHIGIGRRHAGTRVLLLVRDLRIRVVSADGELLRELTLDPTRDYQPQTRPPASGEDAVAR